MGKTSNCTRGLPQLPGAVIFLTSLREYTPPNQILALTKTIITVRNSLTLLTPMAERFSICIIKTKLLSPSIHYRDI